MPRLYTYIVLQNFLWLFQIFCPNKISLVLDFCPLIFETAQFQLDFILIAYRFSFLFARCLVTIVQYNKLNTGPLVRICISRNTCSRDGRNCYFRLVQWNDSSLRMLTKGFNKTKAKKHFEKRQLNKYKQHMRSGNLNFFSTGFSSASSFAWQHSIKRGSEGG